MPTSKGHIKSTNGLHKRDTPLFFFEKIIPEAYLSLNYTFENHSLFIRTIQIEDQLISIPHGPWGSFFKKKPCDYSDFENLMGQCSLFLKKHHLSKLIIKHPPDCYDHSIDPDWFRSFGFEEVKDLNQHIDFTQPMEWHEMESRKLKKLQSVGFKVNQTKDILNSFDLLKKWRAQSSIPLNISFAHLEFLYNQAPSSYDCWTISNQDTVIAICFITKITSKTAYYFLPATHPDYRPQSPMVMLLHEMIQYYKKNQFTLFDLGQSSIAGKKQEGLFRFKERIGGQWSYKSTFTLTV